MTKLDTFAVTTVNGSPRGVCTSQFDLTGLSIVVEGNEIILSIWTPSEDYEARLSLDEFLKLTGLTTTVVRRVVE
jgi:hypothetical protein